jgi:DNA-binding NarL/FixJ family response regulator
MVLERMAEVVGQQLDMRVCGEASEAGQVFGAVAKLQPDVILLDLNLKGILALDLIRDIKARYRSLVVVVVSMHDESIFAERALRAGAQGYVSKEEPTSAVIGAIRKALSNQIYISERMAFSLADTFVHCKAKAADSSLERLTDRELEILELMGHGLGSRRIAGDLHIDIRTVETHCARMKMKLNLESSTELLVRAIEWVQSARPS